ncbi:hypothetical protein CkaCkLH20_09126 [Colletotrichum karsti]|uniref:Amidohydrolase-related domain-containing protein n=1 Tax=Colletotrichum karsti TaxID=1095194 RepID=A0A9P6LH93_9PEZI|nr:uncharacterized protein CkaCkLH20_09126 [Colletotrichum karsti]KAF9873313.1 hypothetical protein CkaCkLH20_09126 [Colletotrichum karsti]
MNSVPPSILYPVLKPVHLTKMLKPVPPLIALEEHFIAKELLPELSDTYAEQLKHLPDLASRLTDVGPLRLADMNKNNIAVQAVSHAPGLAALPPGLSHRANEALAEAIKAHPRRLVGLAVLPMSTPDIAAQMLRRSVRWLGFRGALIDAHADGTHYDHPRFWGVFRVAEELDVPVYLHPTWPSQVQRRAYEGNYAEGAARSLGTSGFGWHSETGLAVLKLFAAGLFDEVPKLKIVIGHFGEMLPFMMERVGKLSTRWGERKRPWEEVWRENIWVTTSGVWGLAPMACLLMNTPIEHIMYSVDYPFEKSENGLAWMKDLIDSRVATVEEVEMIAHKNAERLLKVKVAR